MHAEQQTATQAIGNPANQQAHANPQPDRQLNKQQQSFAIELAKGANKTDAYIAAFHHKGKRKYAANSALKLSRDPRIVDFIERLSHRAIDLKGVTNQDVELGLAELAFSDIRQLFGPDDEFLPPSKWPDSIARCVARYEEHVLPGGNILRRKISLWDKPGSLKLLAEIKAMLHGKPDSTQRAHFTFDLTGMKPGRAPATAPKRVKGRVLDAESPLLPVPAQVKVDLVVPVDAEPTSGEAR